MNNISANVLCVFETTDERIKAQAYILTLISALESEKDYKLSSISLTQWSSSSDNKAQVFTHDDKKYYRYTASIAFSYSADTDYNKTNENLTELLTQNVATDNMNVQKIDLSISELVATETNEDTTAE